MHSVVAPSPSAPVVWQDAKGPVISFCIGGLVVYTWLVEWYKVFWFSVRDVAIHLYSLFNLWHPALQEISDKWLIPALLVLVIVLILLLIALVSRKNTSAISGASAGNQHAKLDDQSPQLSAVIQSLSRIQLQRMLREILAAELKGMAANSVTPATVTPITTALPLTNHVEAFLAAEINILRAEMSGLRRKIHRLYGHVDRRLAGIEQQIGYGDSCITQ